MKWKDNEMEWKARPMRARFAVYLFPTVGLQDCDRQEREGPLGGSSKGSATSRGRCKHNSQVCRK